MKLLLISSFFESPYHKNRAPYNEQLFLSLNRYYDIRIIRPIAWTDIKRSAIRLNKDKYYRSIWKTIPIYYPTYYFVPRLGIPLNGIFYYYSIQKAMNSLDFKPDLIYTTWAYPDAYAAERYSKALNVPFVVRVHGSDINDLAQRNNLRQKILNTLSKAASIISPSMALKVKMTELGVDKDKIRVIYSGIDTRRFFKQSKTEACKMVGLDGDCKRIIYIGSYKKGKGIFDLLKACQIMVKSGHRFELILIGWGEEEKNVNRFIRNEGLTNYVKNIGAVDHHLLRSWICASDTLCLPSYAEGLPNVILEALACGRNVVATDVGGIAEVIKEAEKYLIRPGQVDRLSEKLYSALYDDSYKTIPSISLRSYDEIACEIKEDLESIVTQFEKTGV